jgi:hypothetical protein
MIVVRSTAVLARASTTPRRLPLPADACGGAQAQRGASVIAD